jgi:hypothetical protein
MTESELKTAIFQSLSGIAWLPKHDLDESDLAEIAEDVATDLMGLDLLVTDYELERREAVQ